MSHNQEMETEIIERNGLHFKVVRYYDTDHGAPWEENEGHGPVRESGRSHRHQREKKAGEIPLNDPDRGEYQYFYDWQAAVKTARAEWGIGPEPLAALTAKLGRAPTKGEIAVAAVKRDVKFLRGYLNNDWWYIGVEVTMVTVDEDGHVTEEFQSDSLWGIQSSDNYWEEHRDEMIESLSSDALKEREERQYWAERDVVTA